MKNSVKGDVLSWGTGAYGRLGVGTPTDCRTPTRIVSKHLDGRGILCVSGGLYHSALVTDDYGLYVFGTNATGCLGLGRGVSTIQSSDDSAGLSDGSREHTYLPRRIRTLPPRIKIVQVSVGGDLMGSHTLAVSSQGRLYAWGAAKACGVGAVEGEDIIAKPTLVSEFVRSEDSREDATAERVIYASAGGSCSAVITAEGVLYTFGITASGRLGYRDKLRVQYRPRRVDALLGETITAVSAGGAHMLCVSHRGVLYTWGDNSRGQLGLSDLVDRPTPTRVPHPRQGFWSASIAAGQTHSLAVDIDGRLYSWGASGGACIGRGNSLTNTDRERVLCTSFQIRNLSNSWMKPGQVVLQHKVSRVSAGADHSLISTINGLIYTFGSPNQTGLLSDPASLTSVPRLLSPSHSLCGSEPAAICCGNYHSMIVMSSAYNNPGLNFLIRNFSNQLSFHDCFVECKSDGSIIWLNSVALRACITLSAWVSFIVPQLKFLSSDKGELGVSTSPELTSRELSSAEEFRFTPELSSDTVSTSVGSLLDDWVKESSLVPSDIPSECLFAHLSREIVELFFTTLFTDDVPVCDDEDSLRTLLRLAICCQLDRIEKICEKRIKRIERDRTYILVGIPERDRPERAIDELFDSRFSTGDMRIECGDPVFRNRLTSGDVGRTIVCHSFVMEAFGSGSTVPSTVPLDVMDELVHFAYKMKFSSNSDDSDLTRKVGFWLLVCQTAIDTFRNTLAVSAGIDKIVGMVTRSNWEKIAQIFSTFISSGVAREHTWFKQLFQAIFPLGTIMVSEKVLSSKSFNSVSTYTYSKAELPGAIKRSLGELEIGIVEDPIIGPELVRRINDTIEAHVQMARLIRNEMDHYRELELAAKGGELAEKESNLKRWLKSITISHRGGPSVISAFRDLGIFVALFAIASTFVAESKFARKFLPSDYWSSIAILVLNFAFLILAGYLIYTGVVSSKV